MFDTDTQVVEFGKMATLKVDLSSEMSEQPWFRVQDCTDEEPPHYRCSFSLFCMKVLVYFRWVMFCILKLKLFKKIKFSLGQTNKFLFFFLTICSCVGWSSLPQRDLPAVCKFF